MNITVDSLIKNKEHRLILYKEMLEYMQWCKDGSNRFVGGFCINFWQNKDQSYHNKNGKITSCSIDIYNEELFNEALPELYAQKPEVVYTNERNIEWWFEPRLIEPRILCLENAIKVLKK